MSIARNVRRIRNAVRKVAAGLTLFGENISPEVPNDLFVAHLSVYVFAAPFARDARVLDLGSGAGYGSDHLLRAGAASVTAIDIDRRNIRYARKRYRDPRLTFAHGDAEKLDDRIGPFDLIVASNVLEHLHDVRPAFDSLHRILAADGRLVVAVPPIFDEASLRENEAIRYHRSNFPINRWLEMLDDRFPSVDCYRVEARPGVHPDFSDPFPSRLSVEDFVYEPIARDALILRPTISAVFVARAESRRRA